MKVDIRPFAFENVTLEPNDFFKDNRLIDNLQQLKKELALRYPEINLVNIQTISDYHQYLYDKGDSLPSIYLSAFARIFHPL